MSRQIVSAIGAFSLALMLGCQASRPPDSVSEAIQPIVGGTEATTCQWPSVVMLLGPWVCTGALVHPRAVVTAKHCLMNEAQTEETPPGMVAFGESQKQWSRTVSVSRCYIHPTNDIGLCILAEDVTDVPIVPVMAPCEASELLPGKPIVEVGFGVIGAHSRVYGTKKWINGTIERRSTSLVDIAVTTGSQDGEYFGDSGGPLFLRMPDQTWRVVGEDCCSDDIGDAGPRISTYTSVPYHVPWMEEQSGLDLTPCHDQAGWNPDATCIGFPTNPGAGAGDWATLCQGQTLMRWQTCGASPYDAGPRDAGPRDASPQSDGREAGSQDMAVETGREGGRDLVWRDGPLDTPVADGAGSPADGLDPRSDGPEASETLAGEDALGTVQPDSGEPPDSMTAIDQALVPSDTGAMSLDTSAREVPFDRADGLTALDSQMVADTAPADARQPQGDGANERGELSARGSGCACRSGRAGPTSGWTILVSFGLLWTASHPLRRRREQRRNRYLQ